MIAAWPKRNAKLADPKAEAQFERLKAVIGAVRNIRAELNVPLESRPAVRLMAKQPEVRAFFSAQQGLMQALARVSDVTVDTATGARTKDAAAAVVDGIEVLIPLKGLIDPEKERGRLQQRLGELTQQASRLQARLADKQFTGKAPKDVVQQTKDSLAQARETLKKLSNHLAVLQSM